MLWPLWMPSSSNYIQYELTLVQSIVISSSPPTNVLLGSYWDGGTRDKGRREDKIVYPISVHSVVRTLDLERQSIRHRSSQFSTPHYPYGVRRRN